MPIFDIPTLFWILNFSYLVSIVLTVALYFGHNEFPGARFWIAAQLLVALGTLSQAYRDHIPFFLLALGNTCFIAGGMVYMNSALRFRGHPAKINPLWWVLIFGIIYQFLEPFNVNIRTMFFAANNSLILVFVFLILVHKIEREARYYVWLAALPFFVSALGSLTQFFSAALAPPTLELGQLGFAYRLVLLLAILTSSVSLFGYYLLSSVQRQLLISQKSRELQKANRELRVSHGTKDLFVSMLAHDLLGPVHGAARYVRKHLLPPEIDLVSKRRSLLVLAESLEKTQNFLQNILWWSRSQREDWTRNKTSFDLVELLETSLTVMRPAFENKGQKLVVIQAPAPVTADSDSVQLILHNLLSNAMKFSGTESEVEVETGRSARGESFVRITDHGTGIDPELREHLFQIQQKVTTPGTLGEPGNGMGLILCWEFAKLNNANLILTSEPGMGTTVFLRFNGLDKPSPNS